MNTFSFSALLLTALCFCSALGVVFASHLTREAHSEISRNHSVMSELNVQYSQLLIEESTFSEYGLIEREASERLNMVFPGLQGSVMIERTP